jgi:hypothetical protein
MSNAMGGVAIVACDIGPRGFYNLSYKMSKKDLLEEFWGPFEFFLYG